jgi:hypothetical protein
MNFPVHLEQHFLGLGSAHRISDGPSKVRMRLKVISMLLRPWAAFSIAAIAISLLTSGAS